MARIAEVVPATIYDVAERAGVGIATVSRVLNNSPHVRDVTRQRVLAAMEQLRYRPSSFAQRLSSRKGLSIGVIVPFFTRPSFVERLRGVEAAVAESGYDLTVYNVESPQSRDVYFREVPRRHLIDGLLVVSLSPSDEDVRRFEELGVAVVLVDAHHPRLPRVVTDDVMGGMLATKHLVDLGHSKIGCVKASMDGPFRFASVEDRHAGYRRALADAGLPPHAEYGTDGEHSRYQARVVTERLLDSPDPPTAIFAVTDNRAMGVLEALDHRGLRVPGDISVVGHDDVEFAEYLGLTTVRQHLYESGLRGVELLLRLIEDARAEPVELRLPVSLVVRRTTAPPPDQSLA